MGQTTIDPQDKYQPRMCFDQTAAWGHTETFLRGKTLLRNIFQSFCEYKRDTRGAQEKATNRLKH